MDIAALIAGHLLDVYAGQNWTEVNLKSTLDGVTFDEASQLTPASNNSIAGLVNHLAFWNHVMTLRIRGEKVEIPEANGFDNSALADEEEWQSLKKDCFKSGKVLAEAIGKLSNKQLQQEILPGYPSAYKSLQGAVEHVHYHLGQIVILKHLLRALNEKL